jgi:galactose mutarotase-like enzyme
VRYEVIETGDPLETHVLVDYTSGARATVAPSRGGICTRFAVRDDEVLFLDQATLRDRDKNVRGGIPVLFPFAGRLQGDQWTVDGQVLKFGQHGFGRQLPWRVLAVSATGDEAAIELGLDASDATRASYPFAFAARMRWSVRDGALHVALTVDNPGDRELPVAPGWHPYFRVPDVLKAAAHVVTDATHGRDNRTGATVTLNGPIDLTFDEVDLHLADHLAPEVRLIRPDRPDVFVEFEPGVLVVWTLRGKDFVCVEPWMAAANALNTGTATYVPPGGTARFDVAIRIARQG